MARTLAQWLAWQASLHPAEMDLGLDRMRTMLRRLGLAAPPFPVVTIAGTNGKGSTVAYLEAVLTAAGHRPGAYTSPHLRRYNERIRVAPTSSSAPWPPWSISPEPAWTWPCWRWGWGGAWTRSTRWTRCSASSPPSTWITRSGWGRTGRPSAPRRRASCAPACRWW